MIRERSRWAGILLSHAAGGHKVAVGEVGDRHVPIAFVGDEVVFWVVVHVATQSTRASTIRRPQADLTTV